MKRMKKVLALGLAAVLTFGMSVTAFAAPGADTKVGTKDDRGSITVSGIDEAADSTVTAVAYPIIQAHYDGKGVFDGYTKLYADLEDAGWLGIEVNENGLIDAYTGDGFDANVVNDAFKEAADRVTVDALAAKILGIATDDSATDDDIEGLLSNGENPVGVGKEGIGLTPVKETKEDPEGASTTKITSFTSNDVLVGTYLVVIKNSEIKNYTPVLVSSYYTNEGQTENEITTGELDIAAGKAWVKVTPKPSVGDKEVTEVKRPGETAPLTNEAGETITGSANIGDVLTYQIKVNSIPYYGGKHPKFKLTDTLNAGLKYTDNNVTVTVKNGEATEKTLTPGTDYVITGSGGNELENGITGRTDMVIDFVVEGSYTLNSYQGKNMVIEYRATVQDEAGLNQDPNTNEASLDYSKNSHIDGDEGEDPGRITRTYSFDISGAVNGSGKPLLEKVDSTTGEALGEAKFKLYTSEDCTDEAEYTNPAMDSPIKTADDGTFTIKGLAEGTYWLKEVEAPEGYSLNEHPFKIDIEATYKEKTETIEGKEFIVKTLQEWSVKIDDKTADTFSVVNNWAGSGDAETYPINNTKLINLPSTGGIGTTIFTVVGVLLMVGAAFLFFVSRRKAQNGQEK